MEELLLAECKESESAHCSLILTSALAVYITAFVKVRMDWLNGILTPLRISSASLAQPLRQFAGS